MAAETDTNGRELVSFSAGSPIDSFSSELLDYCCTEKVHEIMYTIQDGLRFDGDDIELDTLAATTPAVQLIDQYTAVHGRVISVGLTASYETTAQLESKRPVSGPRAPRLETTTFATVMMGADIVFTPSQTTFDIAITVSTSDPT
ncbi:hypothetical protein [Halosegnis longus]|uniref:hypothetical protein n=1 Tax=Halosegnis longus TaxID=2216012 RepID=UPI00129EDD2B|nr:hypothetical protein [Halosegnis longus]